MEGGDLSIPVGGYLVTAHAQYKQNIIIKIIFLRTVLVHNIYSVFIVLDYVPA